MKETENEAGAGIKLNLIGKLMRIQAELKAPKGQENKFGGYKYRSCEDILENAKPLLKKYGAILTLTDDLVEVGGRVYIKSTAKIFDGDILGAIETTAYAREPQDKKGMDAAQITGTSSSYARKYALNGLFCIDDTKDPDSNEYTEENKARNAKGNSGKKNQDTHAEYWENPQPAPVSYICTDCGRPIQANGQYTPEKIAAWSKAKIGSMKCWDCISTKYAKKNTEENTNAQ